MANSSFFADNPTPTQVSDLDDLVDQVTATALSIVADVEAADEAALEATAQATNALASRLAAEAAQAGVELSATNAASSALAASGSASAASTSASTATTAVTNAVAAKDLALAYRDTTLGYQNNSLTYRNEAEVFKDDAEAAAIAAATFDPTAFYTKVASDARYYTQAQIDTNNYTKAAADGLLLLKAPLISPAFTGTPTINGFTPWDNNNLVVACMLGLFPMVSAPAGWLKANGACVSLATYPNLAALYCGNTDNPTALWGYKCTNPASPSATRSTSGTFIVIPDFRGEFIRAWDDSRGIDSARSLWANQLGAVEAHTHSLPINGTAAGTSGGSFTAATLGTSSTGSYGGGETRPRNLAALVCIKY